MKNKPNNYYFFYIYFYYGRHFFFLQIFIKNILFYLNGYGSKNRLDRPAVIRTSGTKGLRKGA